MERLGHVLRDALDCLADFGLATRVAFGICGMFAFTCEAATVKWDVITFYEGASYTTRVYSDGSYLQATDFVSSGPAPMMFVVEMCYRSNGELDGTVGTVTPGWEQDQLVDFTAAWVEANVGDVVNREYIESARTYFFRAVIYGYDGFDTGYINVNIGETHYLAWAGASESNPYGATFGWMSFTLDDEGRLLVLNSAWDIDGDPIVVGMGGIPEPSSALLLLLGGALLALRRVLNDH